MIDRLNVIVHNQPEWLRSLINQASAVSSSSSTLVSTIISNTSLAYKGIQSINSSIPPLFQALRYHGGKIRLEVLLFGSVQFPNSFYLLQKIWWRSASKWIQTIWMKEIITSNNKNDWQGDWQDLISNLGPASKQIYW